MSNRERLVLLAPLVGLAVLDLAPIGDDGPTLCPLALATGIACPGCGMMRAVARLIRGDIQAALAYHPLVLLALALGASWWVWYLLSRLGRAGPLPGRLVNAMLATTAILLVGVWLLRLVSGTLPPV